VSSHIHFLYRPLEHPTTSLQAFSRNADVLALGFNVKTDHLLLPYSSLAACKRLFQDSLGANFNSLTTQITSTNEDATNDAMQQQPLPPKHLDKSKETALWSAGFRCCWNLKDTFGIDDLDFFGKDSPGVRKRRETSRA
jgi:hypothetical protein